MRILKILDGNDGGGIFTCEQQFIKFWRSQNVKVDAIIIGDGSSKKMYENIVDNFYELPDMDAPYIGSLIQVIQKIVKSIKYAKSNIRAVNLEASYAAIIYRRPNFIHVAGLLADKLSCNAFWHLPNSVNSFFSKKYYQLYINKYGIIPVANSNYTRYSLGNISPHIVYPGYDKNRVKGTETNFRKELGISEEAAVYGSASRIDYTKAQDLMVEGFIKAGLPEKDSHLLIAGGSLDSEFAKKVKAKASQYPNNIHFLGLISDLSKFYSTIDVYVNSRRDAEPFGISIAEAMGASLPILAYYKGGPEETVKDTVNGWHIFEPSVESYKAGFIRADHDRADWIMMGENSKKFSHEFEATYNAHKFLNIIRDEN